MSFELQSPHLVACFSSGGEHGRGGKGAAEEGRLQVLWLLRLGLSLGPYLMGSGTSAGTDGDPAEAHVAGEVANLACCRRCPAGC